MSKDERIILMLFVVAGFVGMLFLPMLGMLYIWDEIARMADKAWQVCVLYKCLSILWCMATYAIQFGMGKMIFKHIICKQPF